MPETKEKASRNEAARLRNAIIRHYEGECQYCGARDANHIDHIIPIAHGGLDVAENLILSCQSCNLRKGDGLIADTYIALITAIAERAARQVASGGGDGVGGGGGLGRPSRMVKARKKNRSITLAAEVDAALAAESSRRGVSCSAVVEGVLREALAARGYDVAPTPPAAPAQPQEGE